MISSVKRIILLILIIGCYNLSYSQSVLKKLVAEELAKRNEYMITELDQVFHEVKKTYKVNFDKSDTLYIIQGKDISSSTGFGYIWNRFLKVNYTNEKEWLKYKVLTLNLKIEMKTDSISWYEFDGLVPLVEEWDTTLITKYVDRHNEVPGAIYSWTIYRLIKQNRDYNLDKFTIRDIGMQKKISQPLTRSIK